VQIDALRSENPLLDRHLRFRHCRTLSISRADWCVFRKSVTGRFGIVTAEFGNVTERFGDVTDGSFVTA
jgi:hypothetical protein